MILDAALSQLLIVDVQERLAPAMAEAEEVVANCVRLAQAARHFGAPITISQQYPKGIGPTVPSVRAAAGDGAVVFDKMSFSCVRDEALAARFAALATGADRRQVVICGVEAHVCVLQTALDLVASGLDVAVVADAMSSRVGYSKDVALRRLETARASVVTTEMVIFEWLGSAGTADFKALLPLVK